MTIHKLKIKQTNPDRPCDKQVRNQLGYYDAGN